MPSASLTPGELYINRDRDFRTGEWGPYIKIGIVRDERVSKARASEHQTGNPREVFTTKYFLFETPGKMSWGHNGEVMKILLI